MAQNYPQQLRTANGLEVIVALWLIISPFGLGAYLTNPPLLNSVIVGLMIAFFAILRIVLSLRYGGLSWINTGLGVWLVVSPFLLGFADIRPALWNSVIVGLVMIVLSLWSHSVAKRERAQGMGA